MSAYPLREAVEHCTVQTSAAVVISGDGLFVCLFVSPFETPCNSWMNFKLLLSFDFEYLHYFAHPVCWDREALFPAPLQWSRKDLAFLCNVQMCVPSESALSPFIFREMATEILSVIKSILIIFLDLKFFYKGLTFFSRLSFPHRDQRNFIQTLPEEIYDFSFLLNVIINIFGNQLLLNMQK